MADIVPIPEPKGLPIIGNIGDIDQDFPLGSMVSLADQFGEVYRLRFLGNSVVFVSTQALVNETCDEKRFKKTISRALNVRPPCPSRHILSYLCKSNRDTHPEC
jgi:cytochrome P450/NADPH-cytochrome P450 reductase